MATVIIRSLDDGLAARLKQEAHKRGLSLNKYLQHLLADSVTKATPGADGKPAPRNDLRNLAGRWSARQAREFSAATKAFSEIEPEMWK